MERVMMRVLVRVVSVMLVAASAVSAQNAGAQGGQTSGAAAGASGTIRVVLDATEAPKKIFHSRMQIPVRGGAMTLVYPKWIPGEHGPTGPITDTVNVTFEANGKAIPWTRDSVEMYAYHLNVPALCTKGES